jgi:hypothetical protein
MVVIKICNPMMEKLIVEFIKTQLLIILMVLDKIYFFLINHDTPKSKTLPLTPEPTDQILIKGEPGVRNLLPFKFRAYFVLFSQGMDTRLKTLSVLT